MRTGPNGEVLVHSTVSDSGRRLHVVLAPLARRVRLHDHVNPFGSAGHSIPVSAARELGEALVRAADAVEGTKSWEGVHAGSWESTTAGRTWEQLQAAKEGER